MRPQRGPLKALEASEDAAGDQGCGHSRTGAGPFGGRALTVNPVRGHRQSANVSLPAHLSAL
jgi:hypothetical protein